MATKNNGSLVAEINYLTSLIQSHQASTATGTSYSRSEKRGLPSKHNYKRNFSSPVCGGPGSRQPPIKRSKAGNMVYRPPISQGPSNSGHEPRNETSVVFMKTPTSKHLMSSVPQPCLTSRKATRTVTSPHIAPPIRTSLHRALSSSKALSAVTQQGGQSVGNSRQNAEDATDMLQTPHVAAVQESGGAEVATIFAYHAGHVGSRSSLPPSSSSSLGKTRTRCTRKFINKRAGFKKYKMNMQATYKASIPRRRQLQWNRKTTSKDISTKHQQVPPHPETVGQPTSSVLPHPTTSSSPQPSIPTSCRSSSPPLFPVCTPSYKRPPSVPTPVAPLVCSSPVPLCALPTTSPLLPTLPCGPTAAVAPCVMSASRQPHSTSHHRGVASTQASTSSKRTRYKWKRRLSSTSMSASVKRARKLSKRSTKKLRPLQRYGNKVWVPSPVQPQLSSNDNNNTGSIINNQYPSTSKPPQGVLPAKKEDPKPATLVGYEMKTKRGNKQWVRSNTTFSLPGKQQVKHVRRVSLSRLRSRNKQWVRGQLASSRTRKGSVSRRSAAGRALSKWTSSSVVCMDGGRYRVDPTGKKLKRLLSLSSSLANGGLSETVSGYLETARNSSVKRKMASRVVRKSKVYVWHARMQRKLSNTKYCTFYNHFGKCSKGKDCPYLHDPARIAVCPKFLKGTCDKMDGKCSLSHEIVKGKMPTCAFFLRGICSKDNCPYLHVSVGRDAKVCPDFLKGFCPREEKCTLQHRHDCPSFSLTGTCPAGSKCPLQHRKRARRVRKKTSTSSPPGSMEKEPKAFRKLRQRLAASTVRKMGTEGMEEQAEGEGKEEQVSVFIRNDGELNFMPLELKVTNKGEMDFMPLELYVAPDFIPL